jgi:hypothetical protein
MSGDRLVSIIANDCTPIAHQTLIYCHAGFVAVFEILEIKSLNFFVLGDYEPCHADVHQTSHVKWCLTWY